MAVMRPDFDQAWSDYYDMVYRVAFIHIKKPDDAGDVAQEVFIKFLLCKKEFETEEHKKAWLLRTAHNATMDYFRTKMRKNIRIKDMEAMRLPFVIDETLEVLLTMPERYKTPMYMYYYEGYKTEEIAKILHKPKATVRVNLSRGRDLLRKKLGGED
ncbi:MAG: RNA polymerase sigma factor [Clostridia bacterium]|nr:RNA polymerase sigma factor [Clostridia bacterium]